VRTDGFPVQLLETGHLVYTAVNGDTFVAPFDVSRMALTGAPAPLPERPGFTEVSGFTSVAISPGGTMVSTSLVEPTRALVIVGRNGVSRRLAAPPRNYMQVVVSPNGQRIAVVAMSGLAERVIWTMDAAAEASLRRATVSRFNTWPMWEPDSATLLYSAFEDSTWQLLSQNVDLNAPPRRLFAGPPQEPRVLGRLRDGSLTYTLVLPRQDLYAVTDEERSVAVPLQETGSFDRVLRGFSPDGRWLAYESNLSGQRETFVTAMLEGGVTRQVSSNGGDLAVWAKTGTQLLYRQSHRDKPDEIVRVTVNADGSIGPRSVVATGDPADAQGAFDVFPDGSILMIQELPRDELILKVVVNWTALHGLARVAP
jgi:hypothetical protein